MSTLRANELRTLDDQVIIPIADLAAIKKVVTKISDLKQLSSITHKYASTLGYWAAGDGGQGDYYVDAADTTSADNGGTVIVALDGARWKLNVQRTVSLKQFGARCDGVTDDKVYVQAAFLSDVFHLTVPVGNGARVTVPLLLLTAKRIEGSGFANFDSVGPFNRRGVGSWFYFDHLGVGINFGNGSHASAMWVSGVGTYRNQPTPVSGTPWTPIDADFDFFVNGTDVILKDIMNLNATRGIKINTPTRVEMDGVRGQYFKQGLYVQKATDVIRVSNRQSWPYWSNLAEVTTYTKANLNDIILERIDVPQFSNCFSIFSLVGLAFYQNADGTCSNGMFQNVSIDGCGTAIFVDPAVTNATAQFTNTTIYGPATPVTSSKAITVQGSFCKFDFANLEAANLSNGLVEVFGSTNTVSVSLPRANNWGLFSPTAALLFCQGASNTLNILGPINTSGSSGGSTVLLGGTGVIKYPGGATTGQATINGASTTVVVNHLQPLQPTLDKFQLSCLTLLGSAKTAYVSAVTATNFTIALDVAPGSSITIGWRCALE